MSASRELRALRSLKRLREAKEILESLLLRELDAEVRAELQLAHDRIDRVAKDLRRP
jgi:hypothetical protein